MATTTDQPPDHLGTGIVLTMLAFLAVAVMSALAKAATSAGVQAEVLTFFQNFLSLLLFLPWLLRGGFASLKTQRPGLHLVRAVTGLLSQYLLFVALDLKIPLVDAVLLANAAPLFIPLVVWVWQRQRISARLWASLVIGFVGIILILQPGMGVISWGTPLAIAAGAFSAVALVAVRHLNTTEPPARILFYYFLISSVLTAPFIVVNPFVVVKWSTPESRAWIWLLGVGVSMAISQLLLILAYQQASPSRLSPFNYSVVVFSGLIGWIIWDHVPNLLSLSGILLVCLGGILSTFQFHRVHGHLPAARPRVELGVPPSAGDGP
jgi:drug/metabolite transporter (DMT)-like permease